MVVSGGGAVDTCVIGSVCIHGCLYLFSRIQPGHRYAIIAMQSCYAIMLPSTPLPAPDSICTYAAV